MRGREYGCGYCKGNGLCETCNGTGINGLNGSADALNWSQQSPAVRLVATLAPLFVFYRLIQKLGRWDPLIAAAF